ASINNRYYYNTYNISLMNKNNINLLNPEEYLKDIEKRIKELKNIDFGPKKYKQLEQQEETIFQQSKVIIDQNKSARAELVQAYIINCIRKEEPEEYISNIAKVYKQDLEYLTKITNQTYLNATQKHSLTYKS